MHCLLLASGGMRRALNSKKLDFHKAKKTMAETCDTKWLSANGSRILHTTNRRPINPLFALLLKTKGIKVLKGLSIIFGRTFRKVHGKLPEPVRMQLTKHRIFFSACAFTLPFLSYYSYTHYDTCPITGRKRWITFTRDQVIVLSQFDYQHLLQQYSEKLLNENHPIYIKNMEIIQSLIAGNRDLEIVKDTVWNLNVIEDASISNAFVLPNGQIFVFTGMLKMLNTWEEMAIILGHEMAHAILGHSQEQQSYLAFGELLTVPLLAFIWFFFDDFLAFLMYTIQQYLYPLIFEYGFNLPYSRLLEKEADEVGLEIASKACFDPRWSVLLWEKMAMKEALDGDDGLDEEFDYLSTHPSNQKRSAQLEQKLPEMMKKRSECNCPPLPSNIDPQYAAEQMRKCVHNVRERRKISQELQEKSQILQQRGGNSESLLNEENRKGIEEEASILQHRMNQLEAEYNLLIELKPQEAQGSQRHDEKRGLIPGIWYKVMGEVVKTGNLGNTLFETEPAGIDQLKTVDLKHSALGKS